jgi:hypothetical protein
LDERLFNQSRATARPRLGKFAGKSAGKKGRRVMLKTPFASSAARIFLLCHPSRPEPQLTHPRPRKMRTQYQRFNFQISSCI